MLLIHELDTATLEVKRTNASHAGFYRFLICLSFSFRSFEIESAEICWQASTHIQNLDNPQLKQLFNLLAIPPFQFSSGFKDMVNHFKLAHRVFTKEMFRAQIGVFPAIYVASSRPHATDT